MIESDSFLVTTRCYCHEGHVQLLVCICQFGCQSAKRKIRREREGGGGERKREEGERETHGEREEGRERVRE